MYFLINTKTHILTLQHKILLQLKSTDIPSMRVLSIYFSTKGFIPPILNYFTVSKWSFLQQAIR